MASPNLRTNIAAGNTGAIADTNTVHGVVNNVWSAPAIIRYNGSTLPLRSTVTSDTTKTVFWASPASYPPPSGGGYAIDGIDFWLVIP